MDDSLSARDPMVGLDFGAKRFYSHVSTLTNGSQYFASRFNTESLLQPGGYLGKDEFKRDVYFVDRNGELFVHVLDFLQNNTVDLVPFQENPSLWKALRREALFFGVDGLISLLHVTYSCQPSPGVPKGDRGVLYYLGTDNGRSDTYENPYMAGKVNVTGSLDESSDDWLDDPFDKESNDLFGRFLTYRSYRKATFVHYRQPVDRGFVSLCVGGSGLNVCDGEEHIIIDMRGVHVRPSHYSMRGADCFCLTSDWIFEGSHDLVSWQCLHQAGSESYIEEVSWDVIYELAGQFPIQADGREIMSTNQRDFVTDRAEELLRGTWAVPNSLSKGFYRFFRIQTKGGSGCMHATSFEIFGDVNECPDD